jgi:cyanate permease
MTASLALPAAIRRELDHEPVVVWFTTNAAAKIIGHTRAPNSKAAAMAIPVGGHTAVALELTNARLSPPLPATT